MTEPLSARPTVGVVFRPQSPLEELVGVAAATEAAGVEDLWLWEDCFLHGGLTTAAAALAGSTRVRVGIGLLPVPLRNPAVLAMELATLARLWPGRTSIGLGHGVLEWMAQVGAGVESPMTLLREVTTAVRDLLAGETVSVEGRYIRLDQVRLDWRPEHPPELVIGARGPKTIQLAGELADAVLLDEVVDPAVILAARGHLDTGRAVSGLAGSPRVYAYTEVDTTLDRAALRTLVDERITALSGAGADAVIFQGTTESPSPLPIIDALSHSR